MIGKNKTGQKLKFIKKTRTSTHLAATLLNNPDLDRSLTSFFSLVGIVALRTFILVVLVGTRSKLSWLPVSAPLSADALCRVPTLRLHHRRTVILQKSVPRLTRSLRFTSFFYQALCVLNMVGVTSDELIFDFQQTLVVWNAWGICGD